MVWFLISLYRHGLPTSRRWEFKWDGALSLAALLGCTGILLHSIVDFNMQIPANAALFYVLCALAASELPSQSSRSRRTQAADSEEIGELSREPIDKCQARRIRASSAIRMTGVGEREEERPALCYPIPKRTSK